MRLLVVSDTQVSFLYSPQVRARFQGVDLILGCGDLAYSYLEYIFNALNAPLLFVRGNHDPVVEYSTAGQRTAPHGGVDLHRRSVRVGGLLVAGVEGSVRYRAGPFQYSQQEMWRHTFALLPQLLANRLRYGRFLDVFITHAPPAGAYPDEDHPHQGIRAFAWLDRLVQPVYHFHGHLHRYHPKLPAESRLGKTMVINAYGYRELTLDHPKNGSER